MDCEPKSRSLWENIDRVPIRANEVDIFKEIPATSIDLSGGIRVRIHRNSRSSYSGPLKLEVVVISAFETRGRRIWSLGNLMWS